MDRSGERRVIGQAEITNGKKNPRYLVTDIEIGAGGIAEHAVLSEGQSLYEKFYCARGEDQEQQMDMFADRTSTAFLASNQLRLWCSTFAYLLMSQQIRCVWEKKKKVKVSLPGSGLGDRR